MIGPGSDKKQYLSTLAGWPWLQTFTNWWFISAPKSGREPNPFIVQCGESAENASVCLCIPTKSLSLHLNKKGIECHHCGCNKSPKTSCWKDSKKWGTTNGDYDSNPTFWTIQPSGNPKFAIFCPCSEITNEPFEALVLGGWRGRSSVNLIEPRNFSFRGLNVLKCLSFPIDFWWKWNVL